VEGVREGEGGEVGRWMERVWGRGTITITTTIREDGGGRLRDERGVQGE